MRFCKPFPYHIRCISCLYPPIVEKKFKPEDAVLKIINIVCVYTGISEISIKSKSRKREIKEARQMAMALIKKHFPNKSLTSIGHIFKRDHSTVICSIERIKDLCDTEKAFNLHFTNLDNKVQGYLDLINSI